jgi:TonB family protein
VAVSAALRSLRQDVTGSKLSHTDALVVCNDDSLLIELGSVLGDHYRVHTVDTPASIEEAVDIGRWVGIVDVDSQAGARSTVSRLEVQHPGCPLIVITARPQDWVDSVRRGAVLAAIGRDEVATPRLNEVLRAAQDRLHVGADDGQDAMGPHDRLGRFDLGPQPRGSIWALAAMLLLVLAVSGLWLHQRFGPAARSGANGAKTMAGGVPIDAGVRTTPRETAAVSASPSVRPQQEIMALLSAARVAFRDRRLLPPDGSETRRDSALELYVEALRQDPKNDEALDGVRRLFVIGRNRITTDAANGRFDDANHLLAAFKDAGVDASDLRQLATAVSAAQPKWLEQRAALNIAAGDFKTAEQLLLDAIASGADAPTVSALRAQEATKKLEVQLTALAKQVNAAVQAGALLQPPVDNARTLVTTMRSIWRTHPLTLQAQQQVQGALVQAGEQATRAARFDLAQRNLSAAAELGNFAPLTEATRQLQDARATAEHVTPVVAVAVPPARAGAAAPAPVVAVNSSPHAAVPVLSPMPTPPPYLNAQPRGVLPATYPANADQSGSVIVEFTLRASGLASDVKVVRSDPPGLFDRAAISAVQHGHFSTDELINGRPARARIKLRFDKPDEHP